MWCDPCIDEQVNFRNWGDDSLRIITSASSNVTWYRRVWIRKTRYRKTSTIHQVSLTRLALRLFSFWYPSIPSKILSKNCFGKCLFLYLLSGSTESLFWSTSPKPRVLEKTLKIAFPTDFSITPIKGLRLTALICFCFCLGFSADYLACTSSNRATLIFGIALKICHSA